MIDEPAVHLFTPPDPQGPQRAARLRELGLGQHPDPQFDEFAHQLATEAAAPLAMVNFIDTGRQYFAGLYAPSWGEPGELPPGTPVPAGDRARVMARDHGWCPHVIARRRALVLDDIYDYPRFHGNPVVDEAGIRSYLGAPLIDRTGIALGTICVVDHQARPWGRPGLALIKRRAAEMIDIIHQREQQRR